MNTRGISAEPIIKKRIKKLAFLLEKVLPGRAFDTFFKVSFPVYKQCVRYLYLLQGLICRLSNNSSEWDIGKYRHTPWATSVTWLIAK